MSTAAQRRTPRQLAREQTLARIVDLARDQLSETEPGELSLRAIARELGIASSAIYRYFPSRDALLTALIVQGYDALGERIEAADARVRRREDLGRRFTVMALAARDWAVEQPHVWALLYGSPVPGYVAPQETVAPATRSSGAFLTLLHEMTARGLRPRSAAPTLSRAQRASVADLQAGAGAGLDADLIQRGMLAWTAVLGTISLELFGHLNQVVSDYPAYFAQVVARQVHDLAFD